MTGSRTGNAGTVLFFGALCVLIFSLLSTRIPLGSELRYFESSREMAESGDWIVPRLSYVPYFEKPILLYWTTAASRLAFGDSLIAVRATAILASTLSLLLAWGLALRLGGRAFALRTAVVLLSSSFFLLFGSVLTTDPLFATCLWAAWFCYWQSLQKPKRVWKWIFWIATSLAFMTKGPLALILVGGSLSAFHLVDPPRTEDRRGVWNGLRGGVRELWRETEPRIGLFVLLLLNLPWTILVYLRDPRYLEFFYVRENFRAFFDGSIHHRQEPWFYALIVCAALVPWTVPALIGIVAAVRIALLAAWRGRRAEHVPDPADRLRIYLVMIVLFTLAFLQASSAKLGTYILPIVPALVLLIVDAWSKADRERRVWLRWSPLAGVLFLIAGAGAYAKFESAELERTLAAIPPGPRILALALFASTALGLFIGAVIAARGRFWSGVLVTGSTFVGFGLVLMPLFPKLQIELNAAHLAHVILEREHTGDLVVVTNHFVQDYSVPLELHQRIDYLGQLRELGMGHYTDSTPKSAGLPDQPYEQSAESLPQDPWLFTEERLLLELSKGRRVWLVCSDEDSLRMAHMLEQFELVETQGDARLYASRP